MKMILARKLFNIIQKFYKKRQLSKKIKSRLDMDKTSKYREADFLDNKKGRSK